ncbi:hypothetical protein QQF64_019747, partial [Cirrhinus molitorella]
SDVRIVLLGKNGSENSRAANAILGRAAFHREAPSHSQQHSLRISGEVEDRYVTVINTHLLQTNFPEGVIIQEVKDCVHRCAPGPHVFILVLQYSNFNESDRHRVKYVLNLFSYQAMKHTIVLSSTDGHVYLSYKSSNRAVHNLLKECGGGHLKFDTVSAEWRSEMFRRIEEMLKKEQEEFLICDIYEDEGDGASVDEDQSRSGASVRRDEKEKEDTKTGCDGG